MESVFISNFISSISLTISDRIFKNSATFHGEIGMIKIGILMGSSALPVHSARWVVSGSQPLPKLKSISGEDNNYPCYKQIDSHTPDKININQAFLLKLLISIQNFLRILGPLQFITRNPLA